MTLSKKKIIGTILLLFLILTGINPVFAEDNKQNAEDNNKIKLLAPIGKNLEIDVPAPKGGGYTILIVEEYLSQIYPYLTMIIIAITVLMTVVGSIQIMTAGGDSGKVTEGKDRIMYALIGLLIFLFASAILWTINPNFFTWK